MAWGVRLPCQRAPRRHTLTLLSRPAAVKFTATASDGRVVDTSESRAGAAYFICFEDVPRVPGLDTAVLGLSLGGRAKAVVAAADAFGVRSEDNIIRVPGSQAPAVRLMRSHAHRASRQRALMTRPRSRRAWRRATRCAWATAGPAW